MRVQYQDVIQKLLLVSGILLLGYVVLAATFQLPYGSIGAGPRGRVNMAVAGLVLMLFLPLALILNLGIAGGPVAFGLAPAAWVALAGFVLLLAVLGMEKDRTSTRLNSSH